ncbi:MAG: hypothetical protein IPL46_20205 [Saprospiraceae bacterium]|nr:hypothetical protein [Saprospiraceae bacterium]
MLHHLPIILLGLSTLVISCSSSHTISRDKKKMVEMRSIAILPIEVIHLGRLHDVTDQAESQQLGIEREGFILQRDLYRYFLRDMKIYELERTYLQDLKTTNDLLKDLEVQSASKIELSVREISDFLGVDGIITTSIDQLAPGNALMAGFMNGRLSNDNNIILSLSLRSKYGQIYWKHNDERPAGQDAVYEVSKELLKRASKMFFSVYPTKKLNKKERKEKESKKKKFQIGNSTLEG